MKSSVRQKIGEVYTPAKKPVVAEIDQLWDAVSVEDSDDTAKSALADRLAEEGDFDTASVLDWCIKRKRWPRYKRNSYTMEWSWQWSPAAVQESPKKVGNGLPKPFHEFTELKAQTVKACIENLTVAMATLRMMGPEWRS